MFYGVQNIFKLQKLELGDKIQSLDVLRNGWLVEWMLAIACFQRESKLEPQLHMLPPQKILGTNQKRTPKSSIPAPYDTGSMSNNLNHLTQVSQIQA
jgi:hypothetical protein